MVSFKAQRKTRVTSDNLLDGEFISQAFQTNVRTVGHTNSAVCQLMIALRLELLSY